MQRLHLKKRKTAFKKKKVKKNSMETCRTIQSTYVLRRGQACVEKHFLVELRGNVRDGLAGDEPINPSIWVCLICVCPLVCICIGSNELYRKCSCSWSVCVHLCLEGEVFGEPLLLQPFCAPLLQV